MKALLFATIALAFARVSGASQTSIQPDAGTAFPEVTVCLESHQGQTRFTTADRVIVDLVFSSTKPGFVVNTDANPFQSFRDAVDLAPDGGWVRSHAALFGQGVNGNALVSLDS